VTVCKEDNVSEKTPLIDQKLLARLRSRKAAERERAEDELLAMGPGAVDALLRTLDAETPKRQRNQRRGLALIALYVLLVIAAIATGHDKNLGPFGGMTAVMMALLSATTVQKNAARALARFDDKRAVGPLADALEYNDKEVVKSARAGLTRLLPELRATDHALLTTSQRRTLDKWLGKSNDTDLSMAILRAYEQVGDPKSVEAVAKLADVQTGAALRIRVLAEEVLPAMRQHAGDVYAAQVLLRPSAGDDGSLVRPVVGTEEVETTTLVRPAEGTNAEVSVRGEIRPAETPIVTIR
jgi:hypothetical protein